MESMKNKVLVISAENYCREIEDKINEELEKGWLIELFYEARGDNGKLKILSHGMLPWY